ncbi:MAG TPA: hypothetical protein VNG51_28515 [Ktedonobacteraceae bacterium]|nr:hypothetical protein [Ktedonobacteraceae bacterium]
MATQEERIATLEQTFAIFRQEIVRRTQEADENITILLGVIRHQGQDIRRIFERLESMDTHLESIDTRLSTVDTHLDRVENVLAQILARLPEKP